MTDSEINPEDVEYAKAGPLRAGFYYQDACAANLIIEWLNHPKRYKWMKLEADEYGYLDDISALETNNILHLKQIKFSCHPDCTSIWIICLILIFMAYLYYLKLCSYRHFRS